jgi:hypothetical protein
MLRQLAVSLLPVLDAFQHQRQLRNRKPALRVLGFIGSVVGAYAQSELYRVIVTGPGGSPFADLCRGPDVLIGVNYISGSTLNTIAGVCESQDNGITTGVVYGLNTQGKDPGNGGLFDTEFHAQGAPRCFPGRAIGEMTVALDKNGEVQNILATCVGLIPSDNLAPSYLSVQTGGTAVSTKHIVCSPGDIAIGLIGQSATLINGVGLQCATFPWSRLAAVTPPPATTPQYVKVIATSQIFPMCGGGNADVAKTVNGNEIDLNKGQAQVQLIKIGPAGNCTNWYQLNWPGAPAGDNWVYSAPPPPPNTPPTDFTSLDQTTLAAAEAALGGH